MSTNEQNAWEKYREQQKNTVDRNAFEEMVNHITNNSVDNFENNEGITETAKTYAEQMASQEGVQLGQFFNNLDSLTEEEINERLGEYGGADGTRFLLGAAWNGKVGKTVSGAAAAYKSIAHNHVSKSKNLVSPLGPILQGVQIASTPSYMAYMFNKIGEGNMETEDYVGMISYMYETIIGGVGLADAGIGYDELTKLYKNKSIKEMFSISEVAEMGSEIKNGEVVSIRKKWSDVSGVKKGSKATTTLGALGLLAGIGYLTSNSMKYDRIKDDPSYSKIEKDALIVSITADCVGIVSDMLGLIPNPVTQIGSAIISGISGLMKSISGSLLKEEDYKGEQFVSIMCALNPLIDYSTIKNTIQIKEMLDNAKYEEDKDVLESMYRTGILSSIPVLNMFAGLFQGNARATLTNDLIKKHGSIDNYYEKRFQNLNHEMYHDKFMEMIVANELLDAVQKASGYTNSNIPDHIRSQISSNQKKNVFFSVYSVDKNGQEYNKVKSYREFNYNDRQYEVDLPSMPTDNTAEQNKTHYALTFVDFSQEFADTVDYVNDYIYRARQGLLTAEYDNDRKGTLDRLNDILDKVGSSFKFDSDFYGNEFADGCRWFFSFGQQERGISNRRTFDRMVKELKNHTIIEDFVLRDLHDVNNYVKYALLDFVDKNIINLAGGDDFIALTRNQSRGQRYHVTVDGGSGDDEIDLSEMIYGPNGYYSSGISTYHLQKLVYNAAYNIDLDQSRIALDIDSNDYRRNHYKNLNDDEEEFFQFNNFEKIGLAGRAINTVTITDTAVDNVLDKITLVGGDAKDLIDFSGSTNTALHYLVNMNPDSRSSMGTSDSRISGSQTDDYIQVKYSEEDRAWIPYHGHRNEYRGNAGNDTFKHMKSIFKNNNRVLVHIYGGAGNDSVDYSDSSYAMNISLHDYFQSTANFLNTAGETVGREYLMGIESLKGSIYNDTLSGNNVGNYLNGHDGDDVLKGFGGRDYLVDGKGNDTLYGGDDNDTFEIGKGRDTAYGESGDDTFKLMEQEESFTNTIDGGEGLDVLDYSEVEASIHVELSGDDRIIRRYAQNGNYSGSNTYDTVKSIEGITGSKYGDTLVGKETADYLDGGAGDDTIRGNDGKDHIIGGLGADNMYGGADDDTIIFGSGSDKTWGEAGDDKFQADGVDSYSSSTIDGGEGFDTVDYSKAEYSIHASIDGDVRKRRSDDAEGNQNYASDNSNIQSSKNYFGKDTLSGIEMLIGTQFADILEGSDRNDIIEIGKGDDKAYGGSGDDYFLRVHDDSSVYVDGGTTARAQSESQGTDEAEVKESDTIDYSKMEMGANVVFSSARNSSSEDSEDRVTLDELTPPRSSYDTIDNVENVIGSSHDDIMIGDDTNNTFEGHDGNDRLYGNGGDDVLRSGNGEDELHGGSGNDTLILGSGSDRAFGDSGEDYFVRLDDDTVQHHMDGGVDRDTVNYSKLENNFIHVVLNEPETTPTTEVIIKDSSTNQEVTRDVLTSIENVIGSDKNDHIEGNKLGNYINGGAGDDTIHGHDGDDYLVGGAGSDTIYGGNGKDTIVVSDGYDTVYGEDGDDRFLLHSENDHWSYIFGGNGTDVLDYSEANYTVRGSISKNGSRIFKYGLDSLYDYNLDIVFNVENVIGSNYDDYINGNELSNVLDGNKGNDQLYGGNGDDTLYGGEGNDNLNGGAGNDKLYGDIGNNTLNGFWGDDTIYVGSGSNTVLGGTGDDTIEFVSAVSDVNNTIDGGDGFDHLDYSKLEYSINMLENGADINAYKMQKTNSDAQYFGQSNLSGHYDTIRSIESIIGTKYSDTLRGNNESNYLESGDGNDLVYGYDGQDYIIGGAGRDVVYAGLGNDTIEIGSGADTTYGEEGDDTFVITSNEIESGNQGTNYHYGGAGIDTIDFSNAMFKISGSVSGAIQRLSIGEGTSVSMGYDVLDQIENIEGTNFDDTVDGNASDNCLKGNAGNDTLKGYAGKDTLVGGHGNDSLYGGSEDDVITGESGDDSLYGEAGNDFLSGGRGSDTYYFSGDFGQDEVYDFSSENLIGDSDMDTIQIDGYKVTDFMFEKHGDDLLMRAGENQINLKGWYIDDLYKIENIRIGESELSVKKVAKLMNFMWSFRFTAEMTWEECISSNDQDYMALVNQILNTEDENLESMSKDILFAKQVRAREQALLEEYSSPDGTAIQAPLPVDIIKSTELLDTSSNQIANATSINGILSYANGYEHVYANLEKNESFTNTYIPGYGFYQRWKLGREELVDYVGSSGFDEVTGDDNNNRIECGDGRNIVFGAGGDDIITGGIHNDTFTGGKGNDVIASAGGNDFIYGGSGNDTLYGQDGNDNLYGGSGNDWLDGGNGDDWYYMMKDQSNTVHASEGTFISNMYTDYGQNGHDVISDSGDGRDVISLMGFGLEDLRFESSGNDLLIKHDENNSMKVKDFYLGGNNNIELNYRTSDDGSVETEYSKGERSDSVYRDLGALLAQISAYENQYNVSWDRMMSMNQEESYSTFGVDARSAAEGIVGYNF